jgi:stearoyl-CoA desaturase (Delta-9 desaturase)
VLDAITHRIPESVKLTFSYLRFIALHLLCLAAIRTGISAKALILCAVIAPLQVLSVTVGYHRYFSHRSFKTSRAMQFILAFWSQTSAQKGVLWWAGHHRYHHKHSDQPDDIHSPKDGIWWSYAGWILHGSSRKTRLDQVPDLAKFPELVLINSFPYTPALLLALLCYAIAGSAGVVVGFIWSTILSYHATFANNCFAHIFGTRPYETTDTSRNNWFLALITLGEGWHNNHHRYPGSARNGFLWWEVDVTYYVLLLLSKLGLIWDLRDPPKELLEQRLAQAPLES